MVFDFHDTDLYKLIVSAQFLSTAHVQTFVYQLLVGMKYIHSSNVIHRDLKPDNILVDEHGQPHILDFGLAKAIEADDWDSSKLEVTAAGEFMGTFAYASPEQVSGDPDLIDVRTDVFAIGVMLYEAMRCNNSIQERTTPIFHTRTRIT